MNWQYPITGIIDPSHPAAQVPKSSYRAFFPRVTSGHIKILVFPKAILNKPEVEWPDPPFPHATVLKWGEQVENRRNATAGGKQDNNADLKRGRVCPIDMSMICITGKKSIHKQATFRGRLSRRLKTAISLIVTRDVGVEDKSKGPGRKKSRLVSDHEKTNSPPWISSGTFRLLTTTMG
jgi:hypothetical protein